jgi:hypothetical protein
LSFGRTCWEWVLHVSQSKHIPCRGSQGGKARCKRWYPMRHIGIMSRTGPSLVNDVAKRMSETVKVNSTTIMDTSSECSNTCKPNSFVTVKNMHGKSWHRWDTSILLQIMGTFEFVRRISVREWVLILLLTGLSARSKSIEEECCRLTVGGSAFTLSHPMSN